MTEEIKKKRGRPAKTVDAAATVITEAPIVRPAITKGLEPKVEGVLGGFSQVADILVLVLKELAPYLAGNQQYEQLVRSHNDLVTEYKSLFGRVTELEKRINTLELGKADTQPTEAPVETKKETKNASKKESGSIASKGSSKKSLEKEIDLSPESEVELKDESEVEQDLFAGF